MRLFTRLFLAAAIVSVSGAARAQSTPVADHHQHVFSEEIIKLLGPDSGLKPLAAKDLVPLLDAAGIRKAVLLSTAYMYGSPRREIERIRAGAS
jgi:hypothetical protein